MREDSCASYRDEEKQLVQGQHEAIISEALFYEVQDVLNGKKRIQLVKTSTENSLPLRGFLICPKCGKQLTGSASKGRHSYYYYYHCIAACGTRFKAEQANEIFNEELGKFIPKESVADLYKLIVKDIFNQQNSSFTDGRRDLLNQIQSENDKLSKARKLLLEDAIDTGDYKNIQAECEVRLLSLEAKLTGLSRPESFNLNTCLDRALLALLQLITIYKGSDTIIKRNIIGSIYPRKAVF